MKPPSTTEHRDLFVDPSSISQSDHVEIYYRIKPRHGSPISDVAAEIALLSSVGTLRCLKHENTISRAAAAAKIVSTYGEETDIASIRIVYPAEMFGEGDTITRLLGVATFGSEYNYTEQYRIENFTLPAIILNHMAGPKHGPDGIRRRLNVWGRPLLGAILKPRLGVRLDSLVQCAEQALLGGADFIIDDELMFDSPGDLAFDNRVPALCRLVQKLSKPGETKGYICNVTARPSKSIEMAKLAQNRGASAVVLNGFVMGFPALQDICESGDIGIKDQEFVQPSAEYSR